MKVFLATYLDCQLKVDHTVELIEKLNSMSTVSGVCCGIVSANEESWNLDYTNCDFIYVNENGYDFGTWKKLILDISVCEDILLVNSSIRITDSELLENTIRSFGDNIGFIASSKELCEHVQSYISFWPKRYFNVCYDFFATYRASSNRMLTIFSGELGLYHYLVGLDIEPIVIYPSNKRRVIRFLNFLVNIGFKENLIGLFRWNTINPIRYDAKYFRKYYGIGKK